MAEAAAVSAGLQVAKSGSAIIFGNLNTKIRKDKELRRMLQTEKEYMNDEMDLLSVHVGVGHGLNEEEERRSEAWQIWAQQVRELKYEVEDCIISYDGRLNCRRYVPWYRRKLHRAMTLTVRTRYAKRIAKFRERASDLVQQGLAHVQITTSANANAAPATSKATIYAKPKNIQGIENPKKAILELLDLKVVADGQKLKVISIVGFSGLGKTTLAEAVLHSPDITWRFPRRALVMASRHEKARDLLLDIINQFHLAKTLEPNSLQHQDTLEKRLNTNLRNGPRYFVVIDDLQIEAREWDAIKSVFPMEGAGGRIIVTTRFQSMATRCSSNGGHVYQMQALDMTDSRNLFVKEVFGDTPFTPEFDKGLEDILKKCGGWPLALLDIAQLVKGSPGKPTGAHCQNICEKLGSHLDCYQTKDLAPTRQVIVDSFSFNFNSELENERLRTCLLYASVYQKFNRTNWKSLLRRLSAEGKSSITPAQFQDLLEKGENSVARDQIEELFNRCVIHRRDIRQNSRVKTFQIGPVLLEFMICKQANRNFITLIHDGRHVSHCGKNDSAVRRLYLSGKTARTGGVVTSESSEKDGLSSIRSLTISGHNGDELVDFDKCKMLRVLDVENCKKVEDTDLQKICKLLYLNYLNLRGTNVKTLPRKVSRLHFLQILDMRETNVDIVLPMEVLILGQLVHLFGRFKLPPELTKVGTGHNMVKLVERESKLKTFAGFVLDGCNGFQHIMSAMKRLRKAKVWSGSIQGNDLVQCLVPSLQKHFTEDAALDSLSIDFGNGSIDFLGSVQGPCALESIKLHGKLLALPGFFFEDGFLVRELQLSKTGLSCEALSALQDLDMLLYLKLDEDSPIFVGGTFTFRPTGFKSLKGLSFQTPMLPKMEVMEGAMPALESLQLFSQNIQGLDVSAMECLQHLKEVTLHYIIDVQTRQSWEDEAKKLKNRPTIVFAQSPNTSQGHANN